ncbi:hypothetical protein CW688_11865 [Macrococcoides caseolyticum]|nr:hypothetical protein CW688_11865 [Macrococcus caseolyticus]
MSVWNVPKSVRVIWSWTGEWATRTFGHPTEYEQEGGREKLSNTVSRRKWREGWKTAGVSENWILPPS